MWVFLALTVVACAQDVISVGHENGEKPWMPDLRAAGRRVAIPVENRIDIAILGDGYLAGERAAFEKDLRDWHDRFEKLTPWREFRGAFRVRGLWTPGEARATSEKKSPYLIGATATSVGDVRSAETRDAIFAALDKVGVNGAVRNGRMTHATAMMLVRNENGRNPSGLTRSVMSADGNRAVSVGFAADSHHEFGHAYGGLRDEYIRGTGGRSTAPALAAPFSIFTLSNIVYSKDVKRLPWAHLAPGSSSNPDPGSVIGVLWLGGVSEEGAWHSEARCLMNGTHENWDLARTRRGAYLRDRERFCFWCEELLVARTLQKAGLLGDSVDGEALWKKWTDEWRVLYHAAFDVQGRIQRQNESNAKAGLIEAKIYERPVP